jgi:hypothetical protein
MARNECDRLTCTCLSILALAQSHSLLALLRPDIPPVIGFVRRGNGSDGKRGNSISTHQIRKRALLVSVR